VIGSHARASPTPPTTCIATGRGSSDVAKRGWAANAVGMLQAPVEMCIAMCEASHMPTNLSIDPDLLDLALAVSGERTKKAAVTKALQEFIARRQQKRLLELMGKLEWDAGFDYKAERWRVEPLCRYQRLVAGFPARRARLGERTTRIGACD